MGEKLKFEGHGLFGLIVFFIVGLIVIGGFLAKILEFTVTWNTNAMKLIKFFHRWMGYIILILS